MQHINFCSQLEKPAAQILTARQQLLGLGILLGLVVLVWLGLWVNSSSIRGDLEHLRQQQTGLAQQVELLRTQKQQLENNPALDQEIASLQKQLDFRRRLMARLGENESPQTAGFANHLSGLARQAFNGLWFTGLQLQQGGRQMALIGQTRKPEYVPQYLQKLSLEPVFAGQQFRVFRMSVNDDSPTQMRFEIRSREALDQ